MSADSPEKRLVLIGPGRAGRALVRSWTEAGGAALVLGRDASAIERAARELADAAVEVRALEDGRPFDGDVLVLAVPDDSIEKLAAAVAARASCRFAFHLSGALAAGALAPLAPTASLGSLHPLRAFGGTAGESWKDAFVAVEGDDAAVAAGASLCRRMGARPHRLGAEGKSRYHCAATLAAGGVASLVSAAARLWAEAGLDEEEGRIELSRLAVSAAQAAGRLPFGEALTGPVARRDVATVRLHRDALAGHPDIARLYRLLAAETLRRTPGRGREDAISKILGIGKEGPGSPGGQF